MSFKLRLLVVVLCFSCSSCTIFNSPAVANGAIGAVSGTVVGGVSGALIGNAIRAGDIAKSAMVGAGVGVAAGTIVGVAYTEWKKDRMLARNNSKIEENYEIITERQKEIDELREELIYESKTIEFDESLEEEQYIGPTIGVYR